MTEVSAVEVVSTSKPRSGTVLINVVLDETGSMNSCWDATINSFNDYIGSQKTQGGECRVNLTTFSMLSNGIAGSLQMKAIRSINMNQVAERARATGQNIRSVFLNEDVQAVGNLTKESYRPNGNTNLYDAIGSNIRNVESQLAGMDSIPDVLFVIITDGGENASTEYRLQDVQSLVKAKEQEGWTFIYLGANQNAWQVGQTFGLSKGQTMSYSTNNMEGTMSALADATSSYRGLRASGSIAYGSVTKSFFDDSQQDLTQAAINAAGAKWTAGPGIDPNQFGLGLNPDPTPSKK